MRGKRRESTKSSNRKDCVKKYHNETLIFQGGGEIAKGLSPTVKKLTLSYLNWPFGAPTLPVDEQVLLFECTINLDMVPAPCNFVSVGKEMLARGYRKPSGLITHEINSECVDQV